MMFNEHWFPAPEPTKTEVRNDFESNNVTNSKKPCYDEDYCSSCPAKKYCGLEGYDCKETSKVKDCRKTEDGEILTCIDCDKRTKSIEAVFHGENGCD